jgi:hypothetical protein
MLDVMAAQRGAANLDERAQNMQLRVGILVSALGFGAMVVTHTLGAGRATTHALLLPVLFVGAYGICAGLSRTCGLTAILGRRLTPTGTERIADRAELCALRRRGAAIMATSLAVAVFATALLSFVSG